MVSRSDTSKTIRRRTGGVGKKKTGKGTTVKKINIDKLSRNKFRVFIGPYDNLNSLKKSFNAINVLEFDSIEIIKK